MFHNIDTRDKVVNYAARGVIYNCNTFIAQATEFFLVNAP